MWNWSPVLFIMVYLVIGFFVIGLLIRYEDTLGPLIFWFLDNPDLNLNSGHFVIFVFIWLLVIAIYIFFALLAILRQFFIAFKKAFLWGLRGFRPLPPEPPCP